MKHKGMLLILLLCTGLLACVTGCGEKNDISVENRLRQQDLFVMPNDFFTETCMSALDQFEHLYTRRHIPVPDYDQTRLERFMAYTVPYSTNINRIDLTFRFEHGDSIYMQSLVITDGHIISYIDSSPKPAQYAETGPSISLPDFLTAIGDADFSPCTRIKQNADLYGIEYTGMSDIIYGSTDEVRRILISGDSWSEHRQDHRHLDHAVPVVDFIGAVETEENSFRDDTGLQVYIDQ